MLTIQAAGKQILGNTPDRLYIFCGSEYGIKHKYIAHLESYYGRRVEFETVAQFMEQHKHYDLLPTGPAVYVVRYDLQFLSGLNDQVVKQLSAYKFDGTLVLIYDTESSMKKCDKHFPEHVVRFNPVADSLVQTYLKRDFPELPEHLIQFAATATATYNAAAVICNQLNYADADKLATCSVTTLKHFFYCEVESTDHEIQVSIASRNFASFLNRVDAYPGPLDSVLYQFLSVMVELDKLHHNSNASGPLMEYANRWNVGDIYYMYKHAYRSLQAVRSGGYDVYSELVKLAVLMQYFPVPEGF